MRLKKIVRLLTVLLVFPFALTAQVTTSSISGIVNTKNGGALTGATITATHLPTGSIYTASSRTGGRFDINNMNPGGPYIIVVSYIGFENDKKEDVFLILGETQRLNIILSDKTTELTTVVVAARRTAAAKNGTETSIGRDKLAILPNIGRNLSDYLRFTPQTKVNGTSISIGGQNNRYNGFLIDGAVNNDVFGLSASGTNGGQAGTPPISIDAIDQIVVQISPYDAAMGNFTGGAINAITKSGTNQLHGSAYYVFRNQSLAGKTPTYNVANDARISYPDFKNQTFGFTIGGPIIKNKAFFFINAEKQNDNRPQPYTGPDVTTSGYNVVDTINKLINHVKSTYNYDLGDWRNNEDKIDRTNLNTRFDFNLNTKNKLTISYRYTKAERINANRSSFNGSTGTIAFTNGAQFFPSITHSGNAELNSKFTNNVNNKLRVSITDVNDDRSFVGNPFPAVTLNAFNGGPSFNFGSEAASSANILKQQIINLYDAFKINTGKSSITLGADIDLNKSYNLFINRNFGLYTYSALGPTGNLLIPQTSPLEAFITGRGPSRYQRGYSLVDGGNKGGDDNTNSAANFKSVRLGFFINDDIKISKDFTLTLGLRADKTSFTTPVPLDTFFRDNAAPVISQYYDLDGAKSGEQFNPGWIFSPRIGFKYNIEDENLVIRGGAGIFAGRTPLVWPGGTYANPGTLIGAADTTRTNAQLIAANATGILINGLPVQFRSDVNNQYTQADFGLPSNLLVPQGDINLISRNFKLPAVFKTSFAADKKFGNGWTLTTEVLFTKNINEVDWQNVNFLPPAAGLKSTGPDTRDIYGTSGNPTRLVYRPTGTTAAIRNPYSNVILIKNTSGKKGFSYNFTVQLDKQTKNGFQFNASYTYGNSLVYNEATSSVNTSNWQFIESVRGRNFNVLSTSDFDLGHRIYALISKKFTYANKHAATTITFTYNGQSGNPYSYVYSGSFVGDGVSGNDLMYVPASRTEMDNMAFVTRLSGAAATAAANAADILAQKDQFEEFITSDKYLRKRRGQFAERNGARLPFTNIVDMSLQQEFRLRMGKVDHKLTIGLDMFNFTNFISKDAGRQYFLSNDQTNVVTFRGYQTNTTIPTFQFFKPLNNKPYSINDVQTSPNTSARWNGQLSIKYSF
jgi:Carboxypeptidase regulatory-like domain/TonB dependent receptor